LQLDRKLLTNQITSTIEKKFLIKQSNIIFATQSLKKDSF